MMKRVCNTRFGVCAMLLAVFLLVGGVGAPVCAREDMSAGQAGDPGDGLDFIAGGSGHSSEDSSGNASKPSGPRLIGLPHVSIVLVPIFDGTTLHFIVIFNSDRTVENVK